MAKKIDTLNYTDIVLAADTETIQKALEARVEIDRLLEERDKAYQVIAELEGQVENILGDGHTYPYPEPPEPVFGFGGKGGSSKTIAKAKPKPQAELTTENAPQAVDTDPVKISDGKEGDTPNPEERS